MKNAPQRENLAGISRITKPLGKSLYGKRHTRKRDSGLKRYGSGTARPLLSVLISDGRVAGPHTKSDTPKNGLAAHWKQTIIFAIL